jgi:hypothetical protein
MPYFLETITIKQYPSKTLQIAALLVAIWITPSFADSNFVGVGDCNVQLINSTASSIVVCPGKKPDAKNSISVAYYWLDSRMASFLISDHRDPALSNLLGDHPFILQTEVLQNFRDLVDKFGSRVADHSEFNTEYFDTIIENLNAPSSQQQKLGRTQFDRTQSGQLKRSALGGIKIYDGESPLLWPDYSASKEMLTTNGFPTGYSHYFRNLAYYPLSSVENLVNKPTLTNDDQNSLHNFVSDSLVNWKALSDSDAKAYDFKLNEFANQALHDKLPLDFPVVGPSLDPNKTSSLDTNALRAVQLRNLGTLATGKSISAVKYLVRDGAPPGFLTAYGFQEQDHDSDPMWTIMLFPPRLFVRIVVIQNLAPPGTSYSVQSFAVNKSSSSSLRVADPKESSTQDRLPFPPGILDRGDRIVIPLALEFRQSLTYGREDGPETVAPGTSQAQSLARKAIDRISTDYVRVFNPKVIAGARKSKENFLATIVPPSGLEFNYGTSYEVTSAVIEGKEFPMRAPLARGVFTVAGFQGASCPVLYTRSRDDDEFIKVGPTLRSSPGVDKVSTEVVRLPADTAEVAIAEEEPELTSLSQFEVHAIDHKNRSTIVARLKSPTKLRNGDVISVILPKLPDVSYFELTLTGYFETYTSLIAAAHPN